MIFVSFSGLHQNWWNKCVARCIFVFFELWGILFHIFAYEDIWIVIWLLLVWIDNRWIWLDSHRYVGCWRNTCRAFHFAPYFSWGKVIHHLFLTLYVSGYNISVFFSWFYATGWNKTYLFEIINISISFSFSFCFIYSIWTAIYLKSSYNSCAHCSMLISFHLWLVKLTNCTRFAVYLGPQIGDRFLRLQTFLD